MNGGKEEQRRVFGKTLQYLILTITAIYLVIAFAVWRVNIMPTIGTWDPGWRAAFGVLIIGTGILSYVAAAKRMV